MKYCPNCGNQLNDEVLFCEYCGTSQQTPPQFALQQVSQIMPQAPSIKTKKKRSRKPLILGVVLVLVAILGVICFFIVKDMLSKKQIEATFENFFDAVNDQDTDEIINLCNEDKDDVYESCPDKFQFYTRRLNLYPGLYATGDYETFNEEAYYCYLKGLGYEGDTFEKALDVYNKDIEGDAEILLSEFKTSYEIKEIKKASKCNIKQRYKTDYIELDNIADDIEDWTNLEIDDVYIVEYNVYWEYNGNPYGDDKYLWDSYPDYILFSQYDSYEDYIEKMKSIDRQMIVYKSGGEWYLLSSALDTIDRAYKIEM